MHALRRFPSKLWATSNWAILENSATAWDLERLRWPGILAHDNKTDIYVYLLARARFSLDTTHCENSSQNWTKEYIHLHNNRGWVFSCLLWYYILYNEHFTSSKCKAMRKNVRNRLYLPYLCKEIMEKTLFGCSQITTSGILDNLGARGGVRWPPSTALWSGLKIREPELHNWILLRWNGNLYQIKKIGWTQPILYPKSRPDPQASILYQTFRRIGIHSRCYISCWILRSSWFYFEICNGMLRPKHLFQKD